MWENLKNYKLRNKLSLLGKFYSVTALNYLRNINGSLKVFNNKYLFSLESHWDSLAAKTSENKSYELSNKCHAISDDFGTSIWWTE